MLMGGPPIDADNILELLPHLIWQQLDQYRTYLCQQIIVWYGLSRREGIHSVICMHLQTNALWLNYFPEL